MIFISHRQADTDKSLQVKAYLEKHNISSYIDVEDSNIKNPRNLTEHIMKQLRGCTHIIAIFSVNTRGSYWVPFELGAAYEADLRIATFQFPPPTGYTLEIPEYLHAFPIMKTINDLDKYALKYKNDNLIVRGGQWVEKSLSEKTASASKRSADVFIDEMKSILGQ